MNKTQKINELLKKQHIFHQKALKAMTYGEDSVPFWHIEQSIIFEIIKIINEPENEKLKTNNENIDNK